MTEIDSERLHRDSIVIDAVCPLLRDKKYVEWYAEGGCTVAAPTVASRDSATEAFRSIGSWQKFLRVRQDLMQIRSAADVETAKRTGKLGLLFHFQGTDPIEDHLDLVWTYKSLGVGIMQLCYNVRNRCGDGAEERCDAGLSNFGIDLIKEMNAVRVIVDCAHTGVRTSLDAVEASSAPVVVSHGNPRAVRPSMRNLPDELIRAVAQSGGLIGAVGFPAFVADSTRPTLDQFIDNIAYMVDLVGIDHVALGIDYYNAQWPVMPDEEAQRYYQLRLAQRSWRPDTYPPPPHYYPAGIETPRTLHNLTHRLLERGFGADSVRKILGLNWVRVYRTVWGE